MRKVSKIGQHPDRNQNAKTMWWFYMKKLGEDLKISPSLRWSIKRGLSFKGSSTACFHMKKKILQSRIWENAEI